MITQLSQNKRRGLAISILVLLITLFYLLAINPILVLHRYYDETISYLSFQIDRFEAIATSKSADQAAIKKLLRRNPSQRYYLKQSKPALASTELQQLVRKTIDSGTGKLISTQVIARQSNSAEDAVTVRVRMTGNIIAMQKALYSLEHSNPFLFLDNLAIISSSGSRRSIKSPLEGGGQLNISFDVSGYPQPIATDKQI